MKKKNNEHFEIPSTNIDAIQDLTNIYVDPTIPIKFNIINAKSIKAETINGFPVPFFTPVEPINNNSIIRLGDKQRGNGWRNYTVNKLSYFSMNFTATLEKITSSEINLLQKNDYYNSQIQSAISSFVFDTNIDSSSNEFISFYGPFDEANRKTGLRFEASSGSITGFNPIKLYKIDCSITLYYTNVDDNWYDILVQLKNNDRVIAESLLAAYYEGGMTHAFRLTTTATGITSDGIKIITKLHHGNGAARFWGYNDGNQRGTPNTQISILVEEVRKGL
jgi:hypothetical protein